MVVRPRRVPTLLLCGLLGVCLPGCQFAYEYAVSGRINDFTDGKPLAGVRVSLEASEVFLNTGPVPTAADGSFFLRFRVSDGAFGTGMPRWSLTLEKEGYADEVVDISPTREPTSTKVTNQIAVVAFMKAKPSP